MSWRSIFADKLFFSPKKKLRSPNLKRRFGKSSIRLKMKFNGIELTVAILVRRIQRAAFNISVYLGVSSNRSPLARTQSVRLKTNSDRRYLTVESGQKEMPSRKGLKLAYQNISSLLGNI